MIKSIYIKYRHLIIYLFFGALTTAVNFLVYYPLYNFCVVSAFLSNIIAWFVAVIVAFLTNKPFVFQSKDWSVKVTAPEFAKFFVSRIGSGFLETVAVFLFVDVGQLNGNIFKIVISIVVIVLNYLTSRFFVFKKRK